MHTLVLSTGSNLGDSKRNLESARILIENRIGPVRLASAIYESRAWGYPSENLFFNQCLEVQTELDAGECLGRILEIEQEFGRKRSKTGYSDRIIDIDILFYDELLLRTGSLSIPHSRMHERRFVLLPLAGIMPAFEHPVFRKTISELLEQCTDPLEVRPLEN